MEKLHLCKVMPIFLLRSPSSCSRMKKSPVCRNCPPFPSQLSFCSLRGFVCRGGAVGSILSHKRQPEVMRGQTLRGQFRPKQMTGKFSNIRRDSCWFAKDLVKEKRILRPPLIFRSIKNGLIQMCFLRIFKNG